MAEAAKEDMARGSAKVPAKVAKEREPTVWRQQMAIGGTMIGSTMVETIAIS